MFFEVKVPHGACVLILDRRPDGSVGMALVLPALTDCRWWFESLLVHSGVSSATRRKATGADHKKIRWSSKVIFFLSLSTSNLQAASEDWTCTNHWKAFERL